MTADAIRTAVLDSLTRIAPEAGRTSIDADAALRDQLDLDSMDFLNFILGLHDRLGVDIPEADYSKLSTLNGAVSYLAGRLRAGSSGAVA